MIKDNQIFVFGSNLQGIHGAGAALEAKQKYGAIQGVGLGLRGRSYALPTKSTPYQSLPLYNIGLYVEMFLLFAWFRNDLEFYVTRVGCGLAGFSQSEIRSLFENVDKKYKNLANVEFTWTEE